LAFFALGLMAKSMLVTLPFVLLLLDYWPLHRLPSSATGHFRPWLRAWLGLIFEKIPFLLMSAAICVVTVHIEKNAVLIAQKLTFFGRVGNALSAYADYLGHMIYPVGLAVTYRHSETNPSIWNVGWSALILLSISAGVIAGRRKHPYLMVGWLWYLGMLLPVIDIMQAGQNARADRYTYLPQIGLYILLTWGVVELCASWRHRRAGLPFTAATILAGLLAGAYIQTGYWKNSVTLWTHALACTPANSFVENNLGGALAAQGKWDEAIEHYERALQLKSDYPEAQVNLGGALVQQGKLNEAIQHFNQALQLNPYSADAHDNLGGALASQGKLAEAIQQFERALQCRPDFPQAHYDLGLALASQGKWDEAILHYEQALHLKLDYTDAQYISAVALANQKKWDKAIELYQQVLQHKPDFAEAQNNLGIALATQGKSAEAIQHFQQALKLATAQGNTALAEAIRTRLKSYQSILPKSQTP
jgi:tetratricopeptide (TPR) repeat protein